VFFLFSHVGPGTRGVRPSEGSFSSFPISCKSRARRTFSLLSSSPFSRTGSTRVLSWRREASNVDGVERACPSGVCGGSQRRLFVAVGVTATTSGSWRRAPSEQTAMVILAEIVKFSNWGWF
ncbi:hypothetical protein VIGAN_04008700, partial [Vigna angularis var. angularis]